VNAKGWRRRGLKPRPVVSPVACAAENSGSKAQIGVCRKPEPGVARLGFVPWFPRSWPQGVRSCDRRCSGEISGFDSFNGETEGNGARPGVVAARGTTTRGKAGAMLRRTRWIAARTPNGEAVPGQKAFRRGDGGKLPVLGAGDAGEACRVWPACGGLQTGWTRCPALALIEGGCSLE